MSYTYEYLYHNDAFLTKTHPKGLPRYAHGEDPSQTMAYKHISSFRNAIDVGSKFGIWTRKMGQNFEHVYCFEPKSKWNIILPKNVKMDNITQFQFGLGAQEEQVEMLGSRIITGPQNSSRIKETVQIRTLDSFNLTNIDFIKIDTDGYEVNVLKGAQETLLKWKPIICIEIIYDEPFNGKEIEQHLNELGAQKIDQEGINHLYKLL